MKITFTRETIAAQISTEACENGLAYTYDKTFLTYRLYMTHKQEFKCEDYDIIFISKVDCAALDKSIGDVINDLYEQAVDYFTRNADKIDSWYDDVGV